MSQVDVIVAGWGAAKPPAPLQTLASPFAALRDQTVQAGAVLNPAAALLDPADGRATRRSARERRQATVAAGSGACVDGGSLARLRPPYPLPRLRVHERPRTRMEATLGPRAVSHWLEPTDDLVTSGLTGGNPRRRDRTQPVTVELTRGYSLKAGPAESGGASVLASRTASLPVNHSPAGGAAREIHRRLTGKASRLQRIPLTRDSPGRWRRLRSPQPPPDVTRESATLATARRRLS